MIHAREQYRIVSGRTPNTEHGEAIKKFANETSNHQPETLISNAAIRYQAKRKLEGVASITKTASYVRRLYEPIPNVYKNTTIPFAWITQFSFEYQNTYRVPFWLPFSQSMLVGGNQNWCNVLRC